MCVCACMCLFMCLVLILIYLVPVAGSPIEGICGILVLMIFLNPTLPSHSSGASRLLWVEVMSSNQLTCDIFMLIWERKFILHA